MTLAPATLGVYLCHLHPLLVKYYMRDFAEPFVNQSIFIYPLTILGSALAIYFVAFVVEFLRQKFFHVIKVDKLLNWLDDKIPFQDI
ncbi:hypothetical protein HMPREF9318_02020 [Streptococcus urinalis FB127-CNA-2]|nr:hypothetical protein HMPREF9318_02020 [Streptococcus urinalis FB127-CNA-2]VEF32607.1 acyltransferase 3 [Streptococcus urinalis]